ncbi:MAG: lysophospholipid acyltransferase family protein, partial [Gemmatimonadota bacterium]
MAVADRLEHAAARATFRALAALPPGVADALGSGLGAAAGSGLRVRRGVVESQIRAAFPERDRAWVAATASACYRHFGREAAEIARLNARGTADVPSRLTNRSEAEARLAEWIPAHGGALIVTGHLGNWEMAGALVVALGHPLAAVVKRQRNARFDAMIVESRRRLGIEPVYMEDARARIPGLLRRGVSVALVADQDARARGLFVPFLGRPASTFRGPARLALECGAPLVFGAAVRDGAGYAAVLERVFDPRPGDAAPGDAASPGGAGGIEAERELTARWVARLEARVRRHPEQYFWFHRRWKTRPRNGGTPAEVDDDGR